MIYNGAVMKGSKNKQLYLFILDPDSNTIKDGINISEHKCYKNMRIDQLMIVDVTFKDGTKNIENIDLDEFIYGDQYGINNIFILIHDLSLFSVTDKENNKSLTLEDLVKNGELNNSILECIEIVKNNKTNDVE